jgi:hypothetical protein
MMPFNSKYTRRKLCVRSVSRISLRFGTKFELTALLIVREMWINDVQYKVMMVKSTFLY